MRVQRVIAVGFAAILALSLVAALGAAGVNGIPVTAVDSIGMTPAPGEEALDGLKVDQAGNVYVSGPGGVWIIAADGTHIGTIAGPELPANMAWGDDGRTLYLAARTGLYRIRLKIPGAGAAPRVAPSTQARH